MSGLLGKHVVCRVRPYRDCSVLRARGLRLVRGRRLCRPAHARSAAPSRPHLDRGLHHGSAANDYEWRGVRMTEQVEELEVLEEEGTVDPTEWRAPVPS